jgi:hypothetical protein
MMSLSVLASTQLYRLQVCLAEVVPIEGQRLSSQPSEGVTYAVTEVQPSGMPLAPAVPGVREPSLSGMLQREGQYLDLEAVDQFENRARTEARRRAIDDLRLQQGWRRRCNSSGAGLSRSPYTRRPRPFT